jgi:regulator of RNase E activity RraA
MVGLACTATFRAAAAKPERVANQGLDLQMEMLRALPGPGVIVFQDLDVPWFGATGGEIRCRFYELGGADGVVTSGAIRDIDGVDVLEMPVYASAVTCTHGHHYVPDLDVPVMVGGVTIMPGDLVHGDGNGIVVVPHAVADAVTDVALRISKLEADLLCVLRSHDASVGNALKARDAYKAGIADLRKAVQVRNK